MSVFKYEMHKYGGIPNLLGHSWLRSVTALQNSKDNHYKSKKLLTQLFCPSLEFAKVFVQFFNLWGYIGHVNKVSRPTRGKSSLGVRATCMQDPLLNPYIQKIHDYTRMGFNRA